MLAITPLNIYKEALLIFYGRSKIYLKALGKPVPEHWRDSLGQLRVLSYAC